MDTEDTEFLKLKIKFQGKKKVAIRGPLDLWSLSCLASVTLRDAERTSVKDACQNKRRNMENEFEVTVRQTLVKTASVFTDAVHECVERDYDATTGGYAYTSFEEPDCDLNELFAEQYRSALEIIRCCEQICKELLGEGRRRCAKVDLAELRHDCEYWENEDLSEK